jgi:hypothetical protein
MTDSATHPAEATLRDDAFAVQARLGRLHAASASLAELVDSLGRDGSTATLLAFLDTLERDLALAGREVARLRSSARS